MNIDNLLRDYARHDLQRLCPPAHYWLRDHDPIADRELVEPLLREPVRFGLTPREIVAATAMRDLATYTISSRAIWDAAYPARDSGDTTPTPGMTFDQEREIWARREVFRNSALVYAGMLGDTQLIERYQTPEPAPAPDTATPTTETDSASTAPDRQDMPMKKAALIAALEHEWESIEADLSEATRNGLKDAAHAGKHGEWYEPKARAWAISRGKIRLAAPAIHPAMWPGAVTRNRI